MERKVIVSAVSVILVVGVALGVVALVRTSGPSGETVVPSDGTNNNNDLSAHNKAVTAVCQNSDDHKFCVDTLSAVNTSDPKDYIKSVVKNTMDNVIKAFNMSDRLTVENSKNISSTKMALDDCKDLLEFAIDELQASNIMVNDNDIHNVNDRASELKNWLGAVIAYQQSCLDGFDTDGEKKIQEQLQTDSLDYVGKLTALALDVVSEISKVLIAFNLDLKVNPASRRLLEVDHDGYPTWMTAADRRLLADMDTGRTPKPNVVVAKDGSGQFNTVLDAINSYPKDHEGRYVIYVKAGTYDEYITVDKKKKRILMFGDGPTKTIITGSKNYVDGWKTMRTATFCKFFSIHFTY